MQQGSDHTFLNINFPEKVLDVQENTLSLKSTFNELLLKDLSLPSICTVQQNMFDRITQLSRISKTFI